MRCDMTVTGEHDYIICSQNLIFGDIFFRYAPDNTDDLHPDAASATFPEEELPDEYLIRKIYDDMLEAMESDEGHVCYD